MPHIEIASGRQDIQGKIYWEDGKGLIPESIVKDSDKLLDELVRKVVAEALPLQGAIAAFRDGSLDEIDAFVALLAQDYGVKRGGERGNVTLESYDRCLKLQVQTAYPIAFGPQLLAAKDLVDECLNDWTEGSSDELRAFISRAFQVDAQGKINRGNLLYLLKLNIADDRWQRAMKAIQDSMHVVGSKRYMRIYWRPNAEAGWSSISIDMASA